MKEDRVYKWLLDVQSAILEIEEFLPKNPKNYKILQRKTILKRALERNIEIIGEAITRILVIDPEICITNARRIISTRNFIIHEYEKVSDEVIWSIALSHIPLLKIEIEELIEDRIAKSKF
jgi:uncharacterized protein with HEPN domain